METPMNDIDDILYTILAKIDVCIYGGFVPKDYTEFERTLAYIDGLYYTYYYIRKKHKGTSVSELVDYRNYLMYSLMLSYKPSMVDDEFDAATLRRYKEWDIVGPPLETGETSD